MAPLTLREEPSGKIRLAAGATVRVHIPGVMCPHQIGVIMVPSITDEGIKLGQQDTEEIESLVGY